MKLAYKFAVLTLMLCAVPEYGFSQVKENLVRGVIGAAGSNSSWSTYSVFSLIPGSALFPVSSSTTTFYFGFTAGTEADIGNMVVYTTPRGSLTISAVTPVTYAGISHPSIDIGTAGVCPVAPSVTTPCIVRFDPTTLTMSPSSDYYFVVYFANSTNNGAISGTQPNPNQTSLAGFFSGGADYTQLTVGQSLPGSAGNGPSFLMYVMNN
jgi:hypothetical protein